MDELVVSTVVYLPPEETYEFLVDFPRYADYSKHLRNVARRRGDGGAGTRYAMRFAWWKLTYTVESEVTEVDPPERIEWRIVKNLDASGRWRIEALDELPEDAPDDAEAASRVSFEVAYDPSSANEGGIDLPRFVSLGWVVEKIKPAITSEAERLVERVVADLEGSARPVELTVERRSKSEAG
ncbi:SRPBCC family protein [Halobellus sp. Atlit-38R]|uniref:type II toxin-antitoxin system RatA family toxin n=1 Tax=Halobellus sp. Atlit-38R TaxID=2282131 RepID=UPI000EF1E053|nr:SRPBCC family protein [Halobellus sp. Atlit-38R]RLM90074.1 SRPBCC family protein [Halobellus sp. Atlit-38R]